MSFFRRTALVVALVLGTAAGVLTAPQSGTSSSDPVPVKGTEQIAWEQVVSRAGWIVGFQFVSYVDDVSVPVPDASCTPLFCTRCNCVAALPRMTAGQHRIEMSALDLFGNQSARSLPLYVTL